MALQRSVSIYPNSPCRAILPQYAKIVRRKVTQRVDLAWLTPWLSYCGFVHPEGAIASRNPSSSQSPGKIRLIDVQRGCLVDASLSWTYVCLSYVWGGTDIPRLTKERYARYYRERGIQESDMKNVQTIADAIKLVSRLGFRYLWVDALCTTQDDPLDVSTFIPNMGHIYRHAVLTIVSDSQSASTGIPGISMLRPKPSPTLDAYGFSLVAAQATLSEALSTSRWFSRGWTLQGMCFSKCILLFTEWQAFFQIDDTVYMEDGRSETSTGGYADDKRNILISLEPYTSTPNVKSRQPQPDRNRLTMSNSPGSTTAPRRQEYFLEGEDPVDTRRRTRQLAEEIEEIRKARNTLETFANYKQLVQTYTGRTLTYERDVVKAFEGILEYFRNTLGPHVWGLPSRRFDEALLWQMEKPGNRRAGYPSWSWCGWYLGPGSRPTYLDSSSQSAKYFGGTEPERPSISEPPPLMGLEPGTSHTAAGNGFPDTIVVRATYTTLGIRRDMSPYQGTDSFEVIEPTSQRKLANMTLGPEWATDLPSVRQVTFWELSRRDRRSMNRTRLGFQDSRPRTSGYKVYIPDVVIVMAVIEDGDNLWQRVQVCEIERPAWKSLSLERGFFRMR